VEIGKERFTVPGKLAPITLGLFVLSLVMLGVTYKLDYHIFWVDYLVATLYVATLAVSGVFFLAVTGTLQASWMTPYKRIPEAMTRFLPVVLILIVGMFFGIHTLYEWSHVDVVMNDPILIKKVAWLNETGFKIRSVLYVVIWIILGWRLRNLSLRQDNGSTPELTTSITRSSAIGLILFAFTICFAAFDWIMSIEPHWFSTIFGVYVFAGSFVAGMSFIALSVITLKKWGYLPFVNENHLHDIGKWMFGFSIFWAYAWLSQYLLIWYSNIPEETEYYVMRSHGLWNVVFFGNLIINWLIPFFILLPRNNKRNPKILATAAIILLFGHFVDLYLMVAPMIFKHSEASISGGGIMQLLTVVGFVGLFIFFVAKAFAKHRIVSTEDPNFLEGTSLHQ
jgi:hypothetical protein